MSKSCWGCGEDYLHFGEDLTPVFLIEEEREIFVCPDCYYEMVEAGDIKPL